MDYKSYKYVVFDDKTAIVFPRHEIHREQAAKVKKLPVSAGFVNVSEDGVDCYGDSYTLGLSSKEGDNEIVKNFLPQ